MIKEDNHIFQGMKRDNHPIRQESLFLWDAKNIRITNDKDNTFLSITPEKGTSDPLVNLRGYYVGHCVVGDYLVVFTADDKGGDNYIYRIKQIGENKYLTFILYHRKESGTPPNFTPENPIETLGVIENNYILKVYWVDGINLPRVINITKPEYKLINTEYSELLNASFFSFLSKEDNNATPEGWTASKDFGKLTEAFFEAYPNGLYDTSSFDFVRSMDLREKVNVYKLQGEGTFSPGTILYAFSYYEKYGQETNIFYTTPLYYISNIDRGANPEDKVANMFKIEICGIDSKFDCIRIYSIHRTSLDALPEVKVVTDISCNVADLEKLITYIDKGTEGYTIDPSLLLYIGGVSLIAGCINQKDNTLFLGNITLNSIDLLNNIKNNIVAENITLDEGGYEEESLLQQVLSNTYYSYTPNLISYNAGFMPEERYRLGWLVQFEDGKWSDPIYFGYAELVSQQPWETEGYRTLSRLKILDTDNAFRKVLINNKVKNIRTCVVYPSVTERHVICQGVLNPTVYNAKQRSLNAPYAMSSWFFRPASQKRDTDDPYSGACILFEHDKSLYTIGVLTSGSIHLPNSRGAEIQNMLPGKTTALSIETNELDDYATHFFVDENIVTFHSPDLEFDTLLHNYLWDENVSLRIVGRAVLGAISGDISIQTSTPTFGNYSAGVENLQIGYKTGANNYINGGLVTGNFYSDSIISKEFKEYGASVKWAVYPWHRSGSLNNDTKRPTATKETESGTLSAILSKKKMSNLKFFNLNITSTGDDALNSTVYNISTPQLFDSNEVSLLKLKVPYLEDEVSYFGNVDSLLTSNKEYKFYYSEKFNGTLTEVKESEDTELTKPIYKSKDPVRMKFKSTPHLVFSLGNENNVINILPRLRTITLKEDKVIENSDYTLPKWFNLTKSYSDGILGFYTSQNSGIFQDLFVGNPNGDYYMFLVTSATSDGSQILGKLRKYKYNHKTGLYTYDSVEESFNGGILELKKDVTYITNPNDILPGTTIGNYKLINSKYVYKGGTLYYKFTKVTKERKIYWQIEKIDITESDKYTLRQETFGSTNSEEDPPYPYLLIGLLVTSSYIDDSELILKLKLWVPASDPIPVTLIPIEKNPETGEEIETDTSIYIPYKYGDTWYSRYDCLKTYPFTTEDENQMVEIGSFMCCTRVNIDGRYDKNRGQKSNLNMSPLNFNLFNPVYSQKDNFFNYRIYDDDYYRQKKFISQITWSKEKYLGEAIDTWTNINLANTLDLDARYGKVSALTVWNDLILCFLDKALSQILFNSRVLVPVSDGVPIEIANGAKVDGKRYINNNIGCSNKWSISATNYGIYFIDTQSNEIYKYGEGLSSLSREKGMTTWCKNNSRTEWSPLHFNGNGIRTFYDSVNGDVYFTPGGWAENTPDALCYSEILGQFTSFMSYGGSLAMFNFNNDFYSIKMGNAYQGDGYLYKHNVGDYCNFYGTDIPFSISFISNSDPNYTKIFDTIELQADVIKDGIATNDYPVASIEASNEYLKSYIIEFEDNPTDIKKKFRIWRINIPRAPKAINYNSESMDRKFGRARIRNPWAKITLTGPTKEKVLLHNLTVKYTI